MRALSLCLPLALVAPALAQKADLAIDQKQDEALRISITAEFNINQTNRRLFDGQEFTGRGGRGGGGGGGEIAITQAIVFDRGPASAGWRHYRTLESTTDQGGQERQVQGALVGQRVFLREGALYQGEGADAQPVAANLSRGVPGRISLAGLMASGEISVGYHWLKRERLDLKTRAGVGYVHESFIDGVTDDKGIIDLGLAFRWDIVEHVRFTQDTNYSPSFDGADDYRLRFDSALTFPLGRSEMWKFKVGMLNEYDSMPDAGVERLDNTWYTSFVLDVK